jgi:hypothetical protein
MYQLKKDGIIISSYGLLLLEAAQMTLLWQYGWCTTENKLQP